MATHFSILAWRVPWDRGDWQATVYGIAIFEHNVATKSKHQVSVAARGNLGSLHRKRGVLATGPPEKSQVFCCHHMSSQVYRMAEPSKRNMSC